MSRWFVVVIILSTLASAIELAGDWVGDVRELLLLLFEVFGGGSGAVLIQPVNSFLDSIDDLELENTKLVTHMPLIGVG